jgi:hypothetical protein
MDYHLLFFSPSPSATPTPSPSLTASIVSGPISSFFYRYVNDAEVKLFWWGFRASFYYLLVREIAPRVALLWAAFKAYIETKFPAPLRSLVRELAEDAEEAAADVLDDAGDELHESTEELTKGMASTTVISDNPALHTRSRAKSE